MRLPQKGSTGPSIPPCALTWLCAGTRYQTAAIRGWAGSELLLEKQNSLPRSTPQQCEHSGWQRKEMEAGNKATAIPRDDSLHQGQAEVVKLQAWTNQSDSTWVQHPLLSQSKTQAQSNNWLILQLRFKKKKKKSVTLHQHRHLFQIVTILP